MPMTLPLATLLSGLLLFAALLFLLLYWALVYRPHPRIEGRLHLPGLQAPVEVLRDRWGVPHIYAQNEPDLWFAQGFVHAQDRLWQMEQARRVAAGRISEGVGAAGVPIDRFARVIGFRRLAAQQVEHLHPAAREHLDSYVAGVNAFLTRYRHRLPLEFTLLGLKPEPWSAVDTASISLLLGWALTNNWREELARLGLYAHLGPERAADLLPDYPAPNPAVLADEGLHDLSAALLAAYEGMQSYVGLTAPGQGSNNWVVSGQRTISGQPLLANDPHLAVGVPGVWHLCHLHSAQAGLHLIGASLPGTPGVVLGHNEDCAWGATAAFADTADLYIEQRHPHDPTRFRFGEAWEEAQVWEEAIRVRGQEAPVRQQVTVTRHGPLLNDLLAAEEAAYPPLALRWAGAAPGSNLNALFGIARAHDWASFRQAAGDLVTPTLSFVYADRAGEIAYIAAGKVPIRAQGQGLIPAPGHSGTHEWVGFIPPDELPQKHNPAQGMLHSANHRIVGSDYPHWWGADYFPGYRARRIVELLDSRPRLSIRDFQSFQLDTYNYLGHTIAPYFTLIDPKDPWERQGQKALLEWNYRMEKESAGALVFELTLIHLLDLMFGDKLGRLSQDYIGRERLPTMWGGAFNYHAVAKLAELLEQPQSWWFGVGKTGAGRTREELLAEALKRAVASIKEEIGEDARRWQWGRLHQIRWQHPLGVIRPLRGLLNRGPFPVAGSGVTVNAQSVEYTLPYRTVKVAPLYRMVADPANWDRSTFIACPGQNGLPGHRFYDNLMHIWLEGESIPMAFSRAKVEESDPLYTLRLLPHSQGGSTSRGSMR